MQRLIILWHSRLASHLVVLHLGCSRRSSTMATVPSGHGGSHCPRRAMETSACLTPYLCKPNCSDRNHGGGGKKAQAGSGPEYHQVPCLRLRGRITLQFRTEIYLRHLHALEVVPQWRVAYLPHFCLSSPAARSEAWYPPWARVHRPARGGCSVGRRRCRSCGRHAARAGQGLERLPSRRGRRSKVGGTAVHGKPASAFPRKLAAASM